MEYGGISIDDGLLISGSISSNFSNTSSSMVFVKMINGFFGCVVANPGTAAFKVSFVLPGILPFTLITTWSVTL